MKTIIERFPILGLFAALGLTTAQLQGRQLAVNPQTVTGVTLYSTADITPPATGGNNYTYANENQRISLQQNGNTLIITYKSYGFNHDYSYNGTDSSHRVAAHAWALFEKHTTSMYHNPYWIQLSASFWEGAIGTGYPRSNGINIYRWMAANPTLEDIQAVKASAWAEYY
jgi:hypothetical protein